MGDPLAVRVGPGKLYAAVLGTAEPTDLTTAWNVGFVLLGYTDDGSHFVFGQTFGNVEVAEEYDPVAVLPTARETNVNFALAEMTAANLKRALNGGTITTTAGVNKFDPPAAGVVTPIMLGWESDDSMERWVFRRCMQTGSVDIARQKAPNKSTIPMSFRAMKPAGVEPWVMYHDANYTLPLGT